MWKWCYFNYNLLTPIMTCVKEKKKKTKEEPYNLTWLELSNWYFNAWVHITWQLKLHHFVLLNSINLINLDLLNFIFYNRIYFFSFLFFSEFDSWRMGGWIFFIFYCKVVSTYNILLISVIYYQIKTFIDKKKLLVK